ncbi:hypothetical protein F5Y10DRAFT_260647 [Nemania abortiva]|nr:hypothetical protein F5Y10DRAFT_260647 [Nemania abortiva]
MDSVSSRIHIRRKPLPDTPQAAAARNEYPIETTHLFAPLGESEAVSFPSSITHAENGGLTGSLKNQTISHRKTKNVIAVWWMEIGACVLSLGALSAIIGVLKSQDGKPLTTWSFTFSINTVIAILGAVSRVSLAFAVAMCFGQQKWNWFRLKTDKLETFQIFDDTSRGPWGAIKLIWLLKFRHWAVFGALATASFITLDPFLQAVVTYSGKDADDPASSNARVGRAVRFDTGRIEDPPGLTLDYTFQGIGRNSVNMASTAKQSYRLKIALESSVPDTPFVSAFLNGFINSSSVKTTPNVHCETGNCTWTPYSSIAICSSCNDISGAVGKFEVTTSSSLQPNVTMRQILYSVPGVALLNTRDSRWTESISKSPPGNVMPVHLSVNATPYPSETVSFSEMNTLIVAYKIMKANPMYLSGELTWGQARPSAYECGLSFCVNEYETAVVGGLTNDRVLRSRAELSQLTQGWPIRGDTNYGLSEAITAWLSESAGSLYRREGNPFRVTANVRRGDLQLLGPGQDVSATDTYNLTENTIISTIQYILDWSVLEKPWSVQLDSSNGFSVTGTVDNSVNSDIKYGEDYFGQPLFSSAYYTPLAPLLWNATDLNRTFEGVSTSLSNFIRNTDTAEVWSGTTARWTTLVTVRWPFLIPPLISFLASVIYVALVVWETRRLGLPTWKETVFPMLAYGFQEEPQQLLRVLDRMGKAKAAGGAVTMSLSDSEGGEMRLRPEINIFQLAFGADSRLKKWWRRRFRGSKGVIPGRDS